MLHEISYSENPTQKFWIKANKLDNGMIKLLIVNCEFVIYLFISI